jgi:DNA-binding CsgD family transcriptional regulator
MNPFQQARQIGLRASAMEAEAGAKQWVWLSHIWRELSCGTTRVVDGFFTEERAYLIVTPRKDAEVAPWRQRLAILEDVLCANAQKVVAFERDMAPSTIASCAKASLLYLGLNCNPSRVHPLLQQAARAARDAGLDERVGLSDWEHEGVPYAVVGAARTEWRLRNVLSDAEFKVVRALVEGFSHVEIARERGTSRRTIANQLATAFRRIGVSSRGELLHRLGDRQAYRNQNTNAA